MAAGGTMVIFGQLEFYNVLTKDWAQEVIWDDSHTDALGYRYRIRIVGWIHGLVLANMGVLPTTGDGDAGNSYAQLRYLLAPRSHFEYRVGVGYNTAGTVITPGIPLLVADPANITGSTNVSLLDIENGPRANVLNITNVTSDQLLRIEVEFEIAQLQCLPSGQTPNNWGVLNNRWSSVDDIDKNFNTTRTFTGVLRCSSSQVNAHAFRSLVTPPLQPGMRRDHIQYAVTEDGLNLRYSVTDKEVSFAPPAPATTWQARFSEEFQGGTAQIGRMSHVDIMLGGDRFVDKQVLISLAASMAEAKFQNGVKLAQDNTYFVEHIMVVDEYTDDGSAVTLRATARRTDVGANGFYSIQSKFLGKPITGAKISDVAANYDPNFSRDSRPGETIEITGPIPMVGAFTSYLQSPCTNQFSIAGGLQANAKGNPQGTALPTISAVVNNGIKDDNSLTIYSNTNTGSMYESWHMESHDTAKMGRVPTPVAATGQSSTQFSLGDTWNGTPPPTGIAGIIMGVLHMPIMKKWLTAVGTRIGSPPSMPKPQDLNTPDGQKWKVFGDVETSVANPKPTADGKYLHHVECNIQYAALFVATGGASSFFFGLNPWNITPVYQVGPGANPAPYQPSIDVNKATIPFGF